jgi:hypothetical protein
MRKIWQEQCCLLLLSGTLCWHPTATFHPWIERLGLLTWQAASTVHAVDELHRCTDFEQTIAASAMLCFKLDGSTNRPQVIAAQHACQHRREPSAVEATPVIALPELPANIIRAVHN